MADSDERRPTDPPPSTRLPKVMAAVKNPLWNAAMLVVIIWGIREAAEVLVPITVAVMLAIICSPAVTWLERHKLPNPVAVLLVVAAMMAALAGIGAIVGQSVASFKDSLPEYRERLEGMIASLTALGDKYGIDLSATKLMESVEPGEAAGKAWDFVGNSMSTLGSALSNTIVVVLTMVLILMEGHTVPAKLRVLAGDPEADISHFRRIAKEVQSYLAIKTVLSLITGVVVWVWAAILDVDFALVWGLLAFLLNFIPNVGSILAAIPAVLIALLQHGPGTAAALGAGYIVVNMVVGNVVEPMWMGRQLGLSTTVVFLSLLVWYGIWGNVGMLLSVPLTMMVKIMLEHSKEYAWIAALLDTGEAVTEPEKPPDSEADDEPPDSDPPPRSRRSSADIVRAAIHTTLRSATVFRDEPEARRDDDAADDDAAEDGEQRNTDPSPSVATAEPAPDADTGTATTGADDDDVPADEPARD